jgi:hypothetical protein
MPPDPGSGIHVELDDDRASLRGDGFGVAFRKQGDRWAEAIFVAGPEIELVTSPVAAPSDESPARMSHPVYQEVQLHRPSGDAEACLLLTGLAFHHHFSAAVTLRTEPPDPGRLRLDFDIADRCRPPIECLAASYLVRLDSSALAAADPHRIAWQFATPSPGQLELVAGPGVSLALTEAGRQATRVQVLAAVQPGLGTHRLRYGWRCTRADGFTR